MNVGDLVGTLGDAASKPVEVAEELGKGLSQTLTKGLKLDPRVIEINKNTSSIGGVVDSVKKLELKDRTEKLKGLKTVLEENEGGKASINLVSIKGAVKLMRSFDKGFKKTMKEASVDPENENEAGTSVTKNSDLSNKFKQKLKSATKLDRQLGNYINRGMPLTNKMITRLERLEASGYIKIDDLKNRQMVAAALLQNKDKLNLSKYDVNLISKINENEDLKENDLKRIEKLMKEGFVEKVEGGGYHSTERYDKTIEQLIAKELIDPRDKVMIQKLGDYQKYLNKEQLNILGSLVKNKSHHFSDFHGQYQKYPNSVELMSRDLNQLESMRLIKRKGEGYHIVDKKIEPISNAINGAYEDLEKPKEYRWVSLEEFESKLKSDKAGGREKDSRLKESITFKYESNNDLNTDQVKVMEDLKNFSNMTEGQLYNSYVNDGREQYFHDDMAELKKLRLISQEKIKINDGDALGVYHLTKRGNEIGEALGGFTEGQDETGNKRISKRYSSGQDIEPHLMHDLLQYEAYKIMKDEIEEKGGIIEGVLIDKNKRAEIYNATSIRHDTINEASFSSIEGLDKEKRETLVKDLENSGSVKHQMATADGVKTDSLSEQFKAYEEEINTILSESRTGGGIKQSIIDLEVDYRDQDGNAMTEHVEVDRGYSAEIIQQKTASFEKVTWVTDSRSQANRIARHAKSNDRIMYIGR